MAFNLLASIAPAVVGGIFSSHAQKKQNRSNQKQAAKEREVALEDDASRFVRLRDAAVAGGFNPLTALQFGGTTMGFGSGTAANQVFDWGPTASAAMTAALPEISGQADVARQREVLEQDLLKVQADALRTSTTATQSAINAAQAFRPIGGYSGGGSSGSRMAGPAVAAGVTSGAVGASPAPVIPDFALGREVDFKPTENIPGAFQVQNELTGHESYWVAGADGDAYDIWQLAAIGPQIGAQMLYREMKTLPEGFRQLFGSWGSPRINRLDNVTVHNQQSPSSGRQGFSAGAPLHQLMSE